MLYSSLNFSDGLGSTLLPIMCNYIWVKSVSAIASE